MTLGSPAAIAATLTFRGGTLERYDALLAKLGFEQFASSFGSFAAKVGVQAPPQITFHEVHSYLTAG